LPHVTAEYLGCIEGRGFIVTKEVIAGVTVPTVARSTFKVAYKQSKEQDSIVALQIVHDCLTLAEKNAGNDRGAARQYAQQATQYIGVIKQKLPAIELEPSGTLNCGSADVRAKLPCGNVTIKSTGVAPLQVARVEMTGANSDDFEAGGECLNKPLDPDDSCTMTVRFQPSAPGERNATLVIHQNIPAPDRGTPLWLVGTGTGGQTGGHTLTVTVDTSAAAGRVSSNPTGIDCPDTCTTTFDDGAEVTLTATYDQGSGHVTWQGCDTPDGDNCIVQLTTDRAITAQLSR
jgi:hypothetical protein